MDKRLTMGRYFALLLMSLFTFFTSVSLVYSQDFELVGVRYYNYPHSKVDNNSNNQFSIQEFGAFFNIPWVFKNKKTAIINGLGYAFVSINNQNNPLAAIEEFIHLQAITYKLMLWHQLSNQWSVVGVFEPTLASDFKSRLSNDDLVIQSTAMFIRKFNSGFQLGSGLAYTTRFGNPLVIPVIPLKFESGKHRLNALLPLKMSYTYALGQNLDIGLKALTNGANFNVTGYSNDTTEINKINYTRVNLGPVVRFRPKKYLNIELSGGISTNRNIEATDINNRKFQKTTSTEAFIQVGLVVKPVK